MARKRQSLFVAYMRRWRPILRRKICSKRSKPTRARRRLYSSLEIGYGWTWGKKGFWRRDVQNSYLGVMDHSKQLRRSTTMPIDWIYQVSTMFFFFRIHQVSTMLLLLIMLVICCCLMQEMIKIWESPFQKEKDDAIMDERDEQVAKKP